MSKEERAAALQKRNRRQAEQRLARDLETLRKAAGPVTRREFSEAAGCALATATGRLKRLAEAGLAVRQPAPGDGDKRLVTWKAAK